MQHHGFVNPDEDESGLIFTSCVPWVAFTQCVQPVPVPADCNPRIVFGKFINDGGKTLMPLHIQCNHALVDGYHIGAFYQEFERIAASV
jgi:chloramphenicol O-acetyltransferase type A